MTSFDSDLDALFKSSAGASKIAPHPAPVPVTAPLNSSAKRKLEKNVTFVDHTKFKRPRSQKPEIHKSKDVNKPVVDSSDEDNNPSIENSYRRPASSAPQKHPKRARQDKNSDSESDPDAPPPLHESLLQDGEKPARRKKFVPEGETPEQRDARTIFVGNLPASAANNSARKALQKHILNHLTSAYPDAPRPTIESSRFRSIAFKTPTSKLPSDVLSDPKSSKSSKPKTTSEHNRTRAAEWRVAQDTEGGNSHKTFQTPAQKKKTAFITGALHDSASSSASAYVVVAYPPPVEGQEPPWDPKEVAVRAVKACNRTLFMDRMLRVDRVRAKGAATSTDGVERVDEKADPRTMVFVGNLDFEVHEDAVRELFEKLVQKERGKTEQETAGEDGEESDEEESRSIGEDTASEQDEGEESEQESEGELSESIKPGSSSNPAAPLGHRWVKSVRIIRDKDTQLGKGFAYVQFYDRASADEILVMELGTIKLAKRKLRIQRCKTLPGATLPKPKPKEQPPANPARTIKPDKSGATSRRAPISLVPRVDPTFGDRIRSLSKDERKAVKSSDADRVARRLAKKKARVVMERGARKAGRKEDVLGGRPGGRKSRVVKSDKGKRERSDKAILKKNVKK
ncbi:hypothetical protein FRC07_005189 [Ceratobasidium sp. 392]|nr:hypothetical protein FRC07_005189 [Ceratobasidium sp. 392]